MKKVIFSQQTQQKKNQHEHYVLVDQEFTAGCQFEAAARRRVLFPVLPVISRLQ